MRIAESLLNSREKSIADETAELLIAETASFSTSSYHEVLEKPLVETNPLEQLQLNLRQIADQQARLNFVMREIKYLIKI